MKWIKGNGALAPFVAAFLVSAAAFLVMDIAVMNMQGLNLIFQP